MAYWHMGMPGVPSTKYENENKENYFFYQKLFYDIPSTKKVKFDSNTFHFINSCKRRTALRHADSVLTWLNPNIEEINILYFRYIN